MEAQSLIAKFDDLQISNWDRLPTPAKVKLKKLKEDYFVKVENLNSYFENAENLMNDEREGFKFYKNLRDAITKEYHSINTSYLNQIERYFLDSYCIEISLNPLLKRIEGEKELSLIGFSISDEIFSLLEGKGIESVGIEEAKKAVNKRIYREKPVLTGQSVKIPRLVSISSWSLNNDLDYKDQDYWNKFLKSLSLFECGSFNQENFELIQNQLPNHSTRGSLKVDYSAYELSGTLKVKKIQFFKNSSGKITFQSKALAREFWNFMNFDQHKEGEV